MKPAICHTSDDIAQGVTLSNFRLVSKVDVKPFLEELDAIPDLWNLDTRRQDTVPVQRETETITLRRLKRIPPTANSFDGQLVQSDFDTLRHFPTLYQFLLDFAKAQSGELSRVMIVRLKPNSQVYEHYDAGQYYRIRDRYHLVLRSPEGSILTSDTEAARFREGELWWFNNKLVHEAFNESTESRVHVIFDILPKHRRWEMRWIHFKQRLLYGLPFLAFFIKKKVSVLSYGEK
jgi:hypothetical protein